ncbi:hypothetical protein RUND412_004254 [Rhizina undulata]
MFARSICLATVVLGAIGCAAHGVHHDEKEGDLSWAERHLQEEHHIYNFDAGAFFQLHDYDNSGTWTRPEVLRTYGLEQEDSDVSNETKDHVWRTISKQMDYNRDGEITLDEFRRFTLVGYTLPDFGLGPGHHGDAEYEYEIHHFEKYHDENTRLEDLTHPEDIAHFAKHQAEEEAEERQEVLERRPIIEQNIPLKFRPKAR